MRPPAWAGNSTQAGGCFYQVIEGYSFLRQSGSLLLFQQRNAGTGRRVCWSKNEGVCILHTKKRCEMLMILCRR
jgi:hypothetical protein